MLEYDRIDISEGIDIKKTNASKEHEICHYWYFKVFGFKYQPYLCNGFHGLMQKGISFNDVAKSREQARDNYRNLSEEDKNKKRKYWKSRYHNMLEEKKQRLKEYQKNYRETEKSK